MRLVCYLYVFQLSARAYRLAVRAYRAWCFVGLTARAYRLAVR